MAEPVTAAATQPATHGRAVGRLSGPALIAALVLAGGTGRRLGGVDKPLLMVGGTSILARILDALDPRYVAIAANGDPARFAVHGLPVLPDGDFAGQGPLAGVLAGLDWGFSIGADALLTVPGDTPFIPRGLAARLSPAPACAAAGAKIHYLVALWPVAARGPLRDHLSRSGRRHVARFADMIGMRRVDFPPVAWDSFLNVNTEADLDLARSRVETIQGLA